MSWIPFLRSLRLLLRSLLAVPTSREFAWAVAMGIAVGLVPKGNLLAVLLTVVMCSLRLNLVTALATAVVVSVASGAFDGMFDALGYAVLTWAPLQPLWVWCAERPLAAWTQFNNTVVCGSFLLALAQLPVSFALARRLGDRLLPPLARRLRKSRLLSMWRRVEWGSRLTHAVEGA